MPSVSFSGTKTGSVTAAATATGTMTPSTTALASKSLSGTSAASVSQTSAPSVTGTMTGTSSGTHSKNYTPTHTVTGSGTPTRTGTGSGTPSRSPHATVTPSVTQSSASTPSRTVSVTPSNTATASGPLIFQLLGYQNLPAGYTPTLISPFTTPFGFPAPDGVLLPLFHLGSDDDDDWKGSGSGPVSGMRDSKCAVAFSVSWDDPSQPSSATQTFVVAQLNGGAMPVSIQFSLLNGHTAYVSLGPVQVCGVHI
jgi:hypothetical protein